MSIQLQTEAGHKPGLLPNKDRAASGWLQRKCACGGSAGLTGQCQDCDDNRLRVQRRPSGAGEPSFQTHLVTEVLEEDGHDLDEATRAFMESRFGYDFSRVRVHTNARAAESARAVNALAYTVGKDVVFASGHYQPQTQTGRQLLAHELAHTIQQGDRPRAQQAKVQIGEEGDELESEADRLADRVMKGGQSGAALPLPPPPSSSTQLLQRAPAGSATMESAAENAAGAASPSPTTRLLVDDETVELGPGQMRKSEFLDELRAATCAAADAELAAVGRTTEGCPYLERWIGRYRTRPAQYVERALRRYAPEAANVSNARDYIPLVAARVRRAVAVWATTGRITGVPAEVASELAEGAMLGALGGLLSGMGRVAAGLLGGIGSALGGIFTKAKAGGARHLDNLEQVQASLGSGQSLETGVKSRMAGAFGHDFSSVRVHSDSRAAELSTKLNARAFTIGSDIAFAAGEYRPGTLIGDALLAHELAHVVQQGGATSAAPLQKGLADHSGLEEDADQAAVSAVVSIWRGARRENLAQRARTSLRSGLSIQRCPATTKKVQRPDVSDLDIKAPPAASAPEEEAKPVPAVQPTAAREGDLQMPVVLHFVSNTAPFVQISGRKEYNQCGDKLWDSNSVTTVSNSANKLMSAGFGISLVPEFDNLECVPQANIVKGYRSLGQWITAEVLGTKKRTLDNNKTHIFFLNKYEENGQPSRTVGEVYDIGQNLGAIVKLQPDPGRTMAHELGHTLNLEHHNLYGLELQMRNADFNSCGDEESHLMNWGDGTCVDRWMRREARKYGAKVGRLTGGPK